MTVKILVLCFLRNSSVEKSQSSTENPLQITSQINTLAPIYTNFSTNFGADLKEFIFILILNSGADYELNYLFLI